MTLKFNERFFNVGAQIDFRLSMIQILSSTLSIGYATAIDDLSGERYNELMISIALNEITKIVQCYDAGDY